MKRKAISDKMKIHSLLFWGNIRCPECHGDLQCDDEIEWDHRHALVFNGKHAYDNIRPLHATCHTQKTIRDVKANAKVKRIAAGGKKRKGPPIKSRGFDKKLTKHFDGTTEARR